MMVQERQPGRWLLDSRRMIRAHPLKFYGDLHHSVHGCRRVGVKRRRGEQTAEQRSERPFDVSGTQATIISRWGLGRKWVPASQPARSFAGSLAGSLLRQRMKMKSMKAAGRAAAATWLHFNTVLFFFPRTRDGSCIVSGAAAALSDGFTCE